MGSKSSFKGKKQYGVYATETRFSKNKLRKLKKHVATNPNDEKSRQDLERLEKNCPYTRKASSNKIWSPGKMLFASLLNKAGFKGDIALIDPDKDSDKFRKAFGITEYEKSEAKNSKKSKKLKRDNT